VPDLLERIRSELDDRIAQLRPVADEYARLVRASDALDGVGVGVGGADRAAAAVAAPAPARRRSAARARPARRAAAAPPGGSPRAPRAAPGQTQTRVVEQLRSGPATSSAVAAALGISVNAAAATISRLVKQGRVQRLAAGGYAAPAADGAAAPPVVPPPLLAP
jgi:hypothetical protein